MPVLGNPSRGKNSSRTPKNPRSRKPQTKRGQSRPHVKAESRGEHNQLAAIFARHGITGLALFVCLGVYFRFGNLEKILAKLSPEQTFILMMAVLAVTFCVTLVALVCDVVKKTRNGKLGTLIAILVLITLAIAAWACRNQIRTNIEKANLEAHRWNVTILASGDGTKRDPAVFTGQIHFSHDGSFEAPGYFKVGAVPPATLTASPADMDFQSEKMVEASSESTVVSAAASSGSLECQATVRGKWSYATSSRLMTNIEISTGDLREFLSTGLSQQKNDECAVRIRPLIPEFAKARCNFTSNTGCDVPGVQIRLTPKKEESPTLMPK